MNLQILFYPLKKKDKRRSVHISIIILLYWRKLFYVCKYHTSTLLLGYGVWTLLEPAQRKGSTLWSTNSCNYWQWEGSSLILVHRSETTWYCRLENLYSEKQWNVVCGCQGPLPSVYGLSYMYKGVRCKPYSYKAIEYRIHDLSDFGFGPKAIYACVTCTLTFNIKTSSSTTGISIGW